MMMMKSGPVTAPSSAAPGVRFPEKLHSFLTMASADPFLWQVISWLPGGAAFKIHDVNLFTAAVLPHHFTGMNSFKSFRRQLNLYGIRNQRRSDLDSTTLLSEEEREVLIGAYFHPLLQRDHKELIVRMTRACSRRNNPPKGFKDERNRGRMAKAKMQTSASSDSSEAATPPPFEDYRPDLVGQLRNENDRQSNTDDNHQTMQGTPNDVILAGIDSNIARCRFEASEEQVDMVAANHPINFVRRQRQDLQSGTMSLATTRMQQEHYKQRGESSSDGPFSYSRGGDYECTNPSSSQNKPDHEESSSFLPVPRDITLPFILDDDARISRVMTFNEGELAVSAAASPSFVGATTTAALSRTQGFEANEADNDDICQEILKTFLPDRQSRFY